MDDNVVQRKNIILTMITFLADLTSHSHPFDECVKMSMNKRDVLQLNLYNSNSIFYTTGSEVDGEVVFNLESSQNDYKRIVVILEGKADVFFTHTSNSNAVNHYRETETFVKLTLILWDKTSRQLERGQVTFPFSFQLTNNGSLPSSLDSKDGRIRYTLIAKLIKENYIEACSVQAHINVRANVDINRPDLQKPRSASKEITAGCLCVGRDLINVTASIPRSGYCIVVDSIPIEVNVEPGVNQQLSSISASLIQRISCYAQGQPSTFNQVIAVETNYEMPKKGVAFTWNVPPLEIPDRAELTMSNCSLVQIKYFIRVEYRGRFMDTQHLDIPVIIGNVPLASSGRSNNGQLPQYLPTLTPFDEQGYQPPIIPNSGSGKHNGIQTEPLQP